MYAADGSAGAGSAGFASVAEALRAGGAFADFLNSPAAAGLDGPGCGAALRALGEIQGKLAAAYASFLRRFDAAGGHAADGYGVGRRGDGGRDHPVVGPGDRGLDKEAAGGDARRDRPHPPGRRGGGRLAG